MTSFCFTSLLGAITKTNDLVAQKSVFNTDIILSPPPTPIIVTDLINRLLGAEIASRLLIIPLKLKGPIPTGGSFPQITEQEALNKGLLF